MKNKTLQPQISVCIPVYKTEPYLAQCLNTVFHQNFDSFEIVIVSDASPGRDSQGWKAKKIIRHAQKEGNAWRCKQGLSKIKVNFSEHIENRGILEVRRSLTYEAKGQYCFHLDSDDALTPDALSQVWRANTEQGPFDIVHAGAYSGTFDDSGNFISAAESKSGPVTYGKLEGHEIFHKWLYHEISGYVWPKLIRRELYIRAFEIIPYSQCGFADDFLIFFYISLFAQSYIGLENKIHYYRIDSGMTASKAITSLERWKTVCSTSTVFTVISQWLQENPSESQSITSDELSKIKEQGRLYLVSSHMQISNLVIPALQPQAYEMLCEYWGKDLVELADSQLKNHYNSRKSK